MAGALVTARNEETGVTYTQKTTDAGLYTFPSLPAGIYSVTIEAPGFKKSTRTNNVVEVNTPLAIDIALEVGAASESVSVEATPEALQTRSQPTTPRLKKAGTAGHPPGGWSMTGIYTFIVRRAV